MHERIATPTPPRDAYAAIAVAGGDTARPINLQKRLRIVASVIDVRGASILDAGCGAGEYVAALGQLGADAHGVEYLQEKVAQWDRAHPGDDRVRQGDLEALRFATARFDAAILNEVLEHVPHERAALSELRRVLRAGGLLIVLAPNRLYPFETHGTHRHDGRPVSPSTPFIPWVPLAAGRRFLRYWARNYWPWELRRLLQTSGFEIVRTGWVWQTFEDISGRQPRWMRAARPVLRSVAATLERIPGLGAFGASQLVVARKADASPGP